MLRSLAIFRIFMIVIRITVSTIECFIVDEGKYQDLWNTIVTKSPVGMVIAYVKRTSLIFMSTLTRLCDKDRITS